MKDTMMECMVGGMTKEEKMKMMGKMMEQFFAQEKTDGEGKKEKKGEEATCCPDMRKGTDFCTQMMEQFSLRMKEEETAKEKTRDEKKTDKDECCPDMSKVSNLCSRMMGQFFDRTKEEGKETKPADGKSP